jgi:hypothetical protein
MRLVRAARRDDGLTSSFSRLGALLPVIVVLVGASALACRRAPNASPSGDFSWTLAPDPPKVGPAVLALTLRDAEARPVTGARWRIEGHMAHPGMQPVVAQVTEKAEGRYEARFSFTMAGDWVLVTRVEWAPEQVLERSLALRVSP